MQLVHALASRPRWVFLLDACGALLTGGLLLFVLLPLERHFGLPPSVLTTLAYAAGAFSLYSFTCFAGFRWIGPRYRAPLAAIAIANTVYCASTCVLLVVYRARVTALGVAYFVGESLVVALVVALELATVARTRVPA